MQRRSSLALGLALLAAPWHAWTQSATKRIGVLTAGDRSSIPASMVEIFRHGLSDGGFVEGKNLAIDWLFAGDSATRLADLAAELVSAKVDLIFAVNTPAALAAKRATALLPILFIRVADPVGVGLAASLARPAGNSTGFAPFTPELAGKRLALSKEALPGTSKMAVLYVLSNRGAALTFKQMEAAAPRLGLTVHSAGISSGSEIRSTIEGAVRTGVGTLMLIDDVVISSHQREIIETAMEHRLPVCSIYREFAEAGALIAYGPNPLEMYRGAADYATRILRGAIPGDLPVQQPARFELIVNLRTANALRLRIPQSILMIADTLLR